MNPLFKTLTLFLVLAGAHRAAAQVAFVDCEQAYATSFENRSIEPYFECTFKRPAYIRVEPLDGRQAAKVWWSAENYDGSRLDRGMEACSGDSKTELRFREDGWYGFNIYFPSRDYPMDKNAIVLQLFAHGRIGSWAGTLLMEGNSLKIDHRHFLTKNPVVQELDPEVPRDTWIPIIIYWKPSQNPEVGKVTVWYNGAPKDAPTYNYTGKFAFDDAWDGDTMQKGIGLKWGQYNADTENYTKGDTRTIYYDDVSQLKGNPVGAWELVNPQADGRDAYTRIDAEYYSDHDGLTTEICGDSDGGFALAGVRTGNWVTFQDVNFGPAAGGGGARHFEARVASETSGKIEVRLDSPRGRLLGTCQFDATGGSDQWKQIATDTRRIHGKRDICLVFTVKNRDQMALNWFRFNATAEEASTAAQ